MSENGMPMLSDFGQARALQYTVPQFLTTHYFREKGTVNWMAPEIAKLLEGEEELEVICTKESDMWAYGMVIVVCFC